MSKTHIVLFHDGCWDGFGAAWAAWHILGDTALYIPVQHGQPLPDVDFIGKQVYLLDFSYTREILVEIAAQATSITVIDHHKTAQEDLAGFPNAIFDLSKSGAILAWHYFHPGVPVPEILNYVQDRDLWQWQMPESKAYNAALRSHNLDFQLWNTLADQTDLLILEGKAILREQSQIIESHVRHAVVRDFHGYAVPIVNATLLFSEIGHALCTAYPDAPFAVTFFFVEETQQIVFNLRSRSSFDVGAFAQLHGGGGHPNAAGFHHSIDILGEE